MEKDGVADEAGLRPGDLVIEIAGQDLKTRRGGQLLFRPPRGDFDIAYRRGGRRRIANINRHIIDQRIAVVVDQRVKTRSEQRQVVKVRRGEEGWNDDVLGAIANLWAELWRRGEVDGLPLSIDAQDSWIASGETWGPEGLGLLFEAPANGPFESVVDVDDGKVSFRLFELPVIAHVEAGGPGAEAGLEVGDVIRTIGGYDVREGTGAELLLFFQADSSLEVGYLRQGREESTTIQRSTRRR